MNAKDLADLISSSVEGDVLIDTDVQGHGGVASFECSDDDGNSFLVKVFKEKGEDSEDSDVLALPDEEDEDDIDDEF